MLIFHKITIAMYSFLIHTRDRGVKEISLISYSYLNFMIGQKPAQYVHLPKKILGSEETNLKKMLNDLQWDTQSEIQYINNLCAETGKLRSTV
jgi:hypothetical protein